MSVICYHNYVLPCVILFLCFSVLLALRLPRLGKRELILVVLFVWFCLFPLPLSVFEGLRLSAFPTFVQFALVWFCLFPLPLGVLEGLRFVIVALLGLFSYLFLLVVFKSGIGTQGEASRL